MAVDDNNVGSGSININTNLDDSSVRSSQAKLDALVRDRMAAINTRVDDSSRRTAQAQLDETAKTRTSKIKPDLDSSEMASAKAKLAELTKARRAQIQPELDRRNLDKVKAQIDLLSRNRDVKINASVDNNFLSRAERDLLGFGKRSGRNSGDSFGKDFADAGSAALSIMPAQLEGIFTKTGPLIGGSLLAGLGTAVAVGLPAIGAMISGALFAAIGTGGVVAAFMSVKDDPRVTGAMNNIKQRFSDIMNAGGMNVVADNISKAIQKIGPALTAMAPAIQGILQAGSTFAGPIVTGLLLFVNDVIQPLNKLMNSQFMKDIINIFASGLDKLGKTIGDFITHFINDPQAMEGAKKGLADLMGLLSWAVKSAGDFLIKMSEVWQQLSTKGKDGKSTLDDIHDVFRDIIDIVKQLGGVVAGIFELANNKTSIWKDNLKETKDLLDGISGNADPKKDNNGKGAGTGRANMPGDSTETKLKKFGQNKLDDVRGGGDLGIPAITPEQMIQKQVQGMMKGHEDGSQIIGQFFNNLGRNIKRWWGDALKDMPVLWGAAWKKVTQGFDTTRAHLHSAFSSVTNDIHSAFSSVVNTVHSAWSSILNNITFGVGFAVSKMHMGWSIIVNQLHAAWSSVINMIHGAWSSILNDVSFGVSWIISQMHSAWSIVTNHVHAFWSNIINMIHSAWSSILNDISFAISWIISQLHAGWSIVVNDIHSAWSNVINMIHAAWSSVLNDIAFGINWAINFMHSGWSIIINDVHAVWSLIINQIHEAWSVVVNDIHAALSVVLNDMHSAWSAIINDVHSAWSSIINDIHNALSSIINDIHSAWSSVINDIHAAYSSIENDTHNVWNGIINFFQGVGHWFTTDFVNFFTQAGQAITNIFKNIWNDVVQAVKDGLNGVLNIINKGKNGINSVMHAVGIDWNIPDIPGLADGGPVGEVIHRAGGGPTFEEKHGRVTGSGSGTSDDVFAKLSNGEFIMTSKNYRESPQLINAIHKGYVNDSDVFASPGPAFQGTIPGMADGGAIAAAAAAASGAAHIGKVQEIQAFLKAQAGKPYVMGAAGPSAWDCSGIVGAVRKMIQNQPPYGRIFDTSNEAGFFTPGFGGTNDENVGWHGGAGDDGHTVGSIGGLNFEATPPHVLVGNVNMTPGNPFFEHKGHALLGGGSPFTGGGGGGIALHPWIAAGWDSFLKNHLVPEEEKMHAGMNFAALANNIADVATGVIDNLRDGGPVGTPGFAWGGKVDLTKGGSALGTNAGGFRGQSAPGTKAMNVTAKKKVDELIAAAASAASSAAGGTPGAGGAPSGGATAWTGVITQALAAAGAPSSWLGGMIQLISRESGGNPNAVNGTDINAQHGDPSRGLAQVIGSTFNAYKLPGHDNIFDPLSNLIAAIRYIQAKYGSVYAGPAQHAYDNGGMLQPGWNFKGNDEPEMALPQGVLERSLSNSGGSNKPHVVNVYVDGVAVAQRDITIEEINNNNDSLLEHLLKGF